MNFWILLKYFYSVIFQRSMRFKLQSINRERFIVLTYHRILPISEVGYWVEPGMYVTPTTLRSHIRFLRKYFEIIAVDQIDYFLEHNSACDNGKPFCVLTFDDGWLDFYTHAWPVLCEERVPTVVYLPTALIGTDKRFWTDRVAKLLKKNKEQIFDYFIRELVVQKDFHFGNSPQRQLARTIEALKKFPYWQINKLLDDYENSYGVSGEFEGRSFMDWNEVRELFASGLVSFGSHSENHAILTTLTVDNVAAELRLSKERLLAEGVVGDKISFCYPNGNYTSVIAGLVAKNGFSSAMSSDSGWNKTGSDLFSLKRISLHQDISFSEALFAYCLVRCR